MEGSIGKGSGGIKRDKICSVCITSGEREGFREILMDNYECKVYGRDGKNSILLACYLDKIQSLQFTYKFYCNTPIIETK